MFYRYSYDYGMVHMIMMGTEHDYTPGSKQYNWLENDLKQIDRKKTPWVMIGGHRAMYASEAYLGELLSFIRFIEIKLALCSSVVLLCSAHKPMPYEDRKES